EGRVGHRRMLGIGAYALFAEQYDEAEYVDGGLAFIQHMLDRNVNVGGRFPELEDHDFVEFLTPDGAPYRQGGDIICDPGHALEYVGFSLKFLDVIESQCSLTEAHRKRCADLRGNLLPVLHRVFPIGFNERGGGMYKTCSLNRRAPVNSDMPWWNLPETMRSAMFAWHASGDDAARLDCLEIVRKCSNAFLGNYVNPGVYYMAHQTLDENGHPVPIVPATPDADPGFHTGLSIIDFLEQLDRATHGAS
ncbi:hypothetical protein ACFLSJ_05995, partial [Verrucomicrobiota bacterium]